MSDKFSMSRREMMASSGLFASLGGCLGSGGTGSSDMNALTDGDGPTAVPNLSSLGGIQTGNLFTPSRNAEVVVWREAPWQRGSTIHADGWNRDIASGDDFSEVMEAVMETNPSKVVIQHGIYDLTSEIEVPSGTIIQGMGPQTVIVVGASRGFWARGRKRGASTAASDLSSGQNRLPVSNTSPFQKGDYVLINSDRTIGYRNQPYGELHKVRYIDRSNGVVEIEEGGLFDDYRTADNATLTQLDTAQDIAFRDLNMVGSDRSRVQTAIVGKYANRIRVTGCKIHDISHGAVRFASCANSIIRDSELFNIELRSSEDNLGYGAEVNDASRNITVENNVMYDCGNHCTTVSGGQDGLPRLIVFQDNEYYGDDADAHFGEDIVFRNNRFSNAEHGILTGAFTTTVESCEFTNIERDVIKQRGVPDRLTVKNCSFKNLGGRAIDLYSNPRPMRRVVVQNNSFEDVEGNVIRYRIKDGVDADYCEFSDNLVRGCGSNVAYVETRGSGSIGLVSFTGNYLQDLTSLALGTADIDARVQIDSNDVAGVDNPYVLIARGGQNRVTGNSIASYTGRGLLVQDPTLAYGNQFYQGDDTGMYVRDANDVFLALNRFTQTSNADIVLDDASDCKVTLNDIATDLVDSGTGNSVTNNFA